jgi:hypothetical protein
MYMFDCRMMYKDICYVSQYHLHEAVSGSTASL